MELSNLNSSLTDLNHLKKSLELKIRQSNRKTNDFSYRNAHAGNLNIFDELEQIHSVKPSNDNIFTN
jgi:hypothetical protein